MGKRKRGPKGSAVRRLKSNVSWVQTVSQHVLLLARAAAYTSNRVKKKPTHIGEILFALSTCMQWDNTEGSYSL